MKMLIIIEQLGIFCILIHFSIIETQLCKTATRLCQEKCHSEQFFSKISTNLKSEPSKIILTFIMGHQKWRSYNHMNVYLSDSQSEIGLHNGFMLYFDFKTCPASDLAQLIHYTLCGVSELPPCCKYNYATLLEHAIRQYIL